MKIGLESQESQEILWYQMRVNPVYYLGIENA